MEQVTPFYEVAPARAMRGFQVVHPAGYALGNVQIDAEYLTSDVTELVEALARKLEEEAAVRARQTPSITPITPPPARVPQRVTGDGTGVLWLVERSAAVARI